MSEKLKVRQVGSAIFYVFWCPGCQETHSFEVVEDGWEFNGDMEKPSFRPSLKYPRCHLWVKNGIIEYGGDCRHRFRGRDIPLQEF